ncbi:hypothetical protein D9615_009423 [Tricholomella constricta]|uniref:Ribosome biogenesis protein YTM1 n=1 Tax=Tricholomella constricta TaxID=117010 RepID=A0A8H5GYL3_9AGAR|nr:hypothetical protein D9615_009423 [Tricholomella constricta]
MASTSNADTSTISLPVVFTTQTSYPLPSQKFMIPATWKRYQLSQLVNKALALPKPVPFDFLVKGEILRTTLAEWAAENGVGEEETLEIEYIESVMPPEKVSDFPHEDWVSSVSCKLQGQFITASYDGHIRTFDYSQATTSSVHAHSAPITSICLVPSSSALDTDTDTHIIASASHDLTAQLTQLSLRAPTKATPLATLHLHTAPLSSIASNTTGTHLLTASWDGLIGLWDTSVPASDEVPDLTPSERERKKRRREDEGLKKKVPRKAPLGVLKSHIGRVSKALFSAASGEGGGGGGGTAYSCGFDSTVRVWDTENGVCVHTISVFAFSSSSDSIKYPQTASEKPFLDLAPAPAPAPAFQHTVLAASTDRTVTLYDVRAPTPTQAINPPISFMHPATPSCLSSQQSSTHQHQFVSGAYDGIVRLWDLRSVKGALATFRAWPGAEKVLSVDVDWERGLVGVGGEGGFAVWKVGNAR